MAIGDVLQIILESAPGPSDWSWIVGAISTEFPLQVQSVSTPVGNRVTVTVVASGHGPIPEPGSTIAATSVAVIPGVGVPRATVVSVEKVGTRLTSQAAVIDNKTKLVAAGMLLVVTAALVARIPKRSAR